MEYTRQFMQDLLLIFAKFVNLLFSFEIFPGVTMGYFMVAIAILGIIFFYLLGRLK